MGVIFKRTKILATIGPATGSYEGVEKLILAGVNGIRINCSHADEVQVREFTTWIRQASNKLNKPVAILQDLQGPKVRLGNLNHNVPVQKDDEIILGYGSEHHGLALPVQYNLADKVQVGEKLFFCDGAIRGEMVERVSDTSIRVRIENAGILAKNKGINLPDTDFAGDILTTKDLEDLNSNSKCNFL